MGGAHQVDRLAMTDDASVWLFPNADVSEMEVRTLRGLQAKHSRGHLLRVRGQLRATPIKTPANEHIEPPTFRVSDHFI